MLGNIPSGTPLYMKSPEGPRLELITLTHESEGPRFTVTPNTCSYDGRKEITLPHLLGFYNKHVVPESPYDGNPLDILYILEGANKGNPLSYMEVQREDFERSAGVTRTAADWAKAQETVPCDPDADYEDSEDSEDSESDGMNAFMTAVAASSFKQQEADSLPPVSAEDTEEDKAVPHPHSQLLKRLRFFKRNLSVFVKLPGSPEWHGIFLRKGAFYDDGEGLNEWHLLNRYRKRFKVKGPSSTMALQAIYVASGVGANESLASLLFSRTDEELATVGQAPAPAPVPQAMEEPPEPGAIASAMIRIAAKEQALLAELAELEKVQAAMARVAALEARLVEARAALKDI